MEYLIDLARDAQADALVTGDAHLLDLRAIIPVMTPAEFLGTLARSLTAREISSALVLPQDVLARPTGVGGAITIDDMLIESRHEWLAAAARHFACGRVVFRTIRD